MLSNEKFLNVTQIAAVVHTAIRDLRRRQGDMETRSWERLHFRHKKLAVDHVREILKPRARRDSAPLLGLVPVERRLAFAIVRTLKENTFPEK